MRSLHDVCKMNADSEVNDSHVFSPILLNKY